MAFFFCLSGEVVDDVVFTCLVWAFHFFADAFGEFFDCFRFLDHVEGKNIFIRLVDVFLEFQGELQQPVGVGLEGGDALLGGFLLHVVRDAGAGFVVIERLVDVRVANAGRIAA